VLAVFHQNYSPVSNSLGLSVIFAALPLITLFVLLGGFKLKAHWAGLASLAVAIVVAIAVYSMPVGQAFDAGAEGAAFGLFPIMWIVLNALWIYNMTEESGHFAVLRRSFERISDDQRVQAIIIAFCFGALLEALAGFGTPVAICSVMLIALGFDPIKSVALALLSDTAPVAFGAIAIPITTLSQVTGLPANDLGAMVGRQTPFIAFILPLILCFIVDGRRGIRQAWPAALVGGFAFAVTQFAISNYVSVPLTDIIASLVSAGALVALLRVWQPTRPEGLAAAAHGRRTTPALAGGATYDANFEHDAMNRAEHDSPRRVMEAFSPYVIIIVVFALAEISWLPFKDWLAGRASIFNWPGLHVVTASGEAPKSVVYKFDWGEAAGTLLLISGLLTMLVLRFKPGRAVAVYVKTFVQIKWAIVTVAGVLALAYVMNLSGETITIATWLAGAGGFFAFLSPLLGWVGVAVTGSDTSSNSLFGALQVTAAHKASLNPTLMAAANSSGGVLGKMISPQNLAIGCAAVGMVGREGDLFRKVIGWSVGLVLLISVLVVLQNGLLSWMVP